MSVTVYGRHDDETGQPLTEEYRMAHHNSTPQSVLDAPILAPDPVWITTVVEGTTSCPTRRQIRPAFVGDVERDLLGVTVGASRKGRKVRR